jgi:hypothetical protein
MDRYLDFGLLDTSYVLSKEEEKQLDGQDASVQQEYPNTGIIRWCNFEHMKASVEHITNYIQNEPHIFVPIYAHHSINEWLRRNEPTVCDQAVHISIDMGRNPYEPEVPFYYRINCIYDNNRMHSINFGYEHCDNSVHIGNMFTLYPTFRAPQAIFFDDIITAILRLRRDKMHAMLLATAPRQNNALKRATHHPLWERQLLRVIGQMI